MNLQLACWDAQPLQTTHFGIKNISCIYASESHIEKETSLNIEVWLLIIEILLHPNNFFKAIESDNEILYNIPFKDYGESP